MRLLLLVALGGVLLQAAESADPSRIWSDAQSKREHLTSFHQEFDVTHTLQSSGHEQNSKSKLVIDAAGSRWRSEHVTGSGTRLALFDGQNLLEWEEGGDEYLINKNRDSRGTLEPPLYQTSDFDWAKAKVLNRDPCRVGKLEHTCVVFEFPIKPRLPVTNFGNTLRVLGGIARILLDADTGLILGSRIRRSLDDGRGGYSSDQNWSLKTMSFNGPVQQALFKLPSDNMEQVKELSAWDAKRIRKEFGGKSAPDFTARDIHGNPVSLKALKGRTVLLDFWTTWCGPCRADAPAIDKLYRKYGGKELAIIGVSVSEDRSIVEKFLEQHPHEYPIILSSENELPRAYQIGIFPTYIIIDSEGTLTTVVQGERGFADLRGKLKKAGLDTD